MSGLSLAVVAASIVDSQASATKQLSKQQAGVVSAPTPAPSVTAATADPSPSAAATSASTTAAAPKTAAAPTRATVNGAAEDTRYGPVQVQITLSGGRITYATAIDYPQASGRDQEINSIAIPQLNAEVLQAQNAQIDTVSGATYTSDGYARSLQSALDAAHA
jgi:uncharacterized protein with FMN-binding domain